MRMKHRISQLGGHDDIEIEDWKSEKKPCPLCKDDPSYCYCGVCDECEFMEEDLNMHIMNEHEPSDVVAGLGRQWAKDRISFVQRNPSYLWTIMHASKWDKLYL